MPRYSLLWLAFVVSLLGIASSSRGASNPSFVYLASNATELWDGLCIGNNQSALYRPSSGQTDVYGSEHCTIVFKEGNYSKIELAASNETQGIDAQFWGIIHNLALTISPPPNQVNLSISAYKSSSLPPTLDTSIISVALSGQSSLPSSEPRLIHLNRLQMIDSTVDVAVGLTDTKIRVLLSSVHATLQSASLPSNLTSNTTQQPALEGFTTLVNIDTSQPGTVLSNLVNFNFQHSSLLVLNSQADLLKSTTTIARFTVAESTIDSVRSLLVLPNNATMRIPIVITNSNVSKISKIVEGPTPADYSSRKLSNILTLHNSSLSGYVTLAATHDQDSVACMDMRIHNSTVERVSMNCNAPKGNFASPICLALISGSTLRDNELCLTGTSINIPHPSNPGYETQFTFVDSTVELSDFAPQNAKMSVHAATIGTYNTHFYNSSSLTSQNGTNAQTAHGGFQYSGGVIFARDSDFWTNAINASDDILVLSSAKLTGYVHIGLSASIRGRSAPGESSFWKLKAPLYIIGSGSPIGFGSIFDISQARVTLVPGARQNLAQFEDPFIFFQNGASLFSYDMSESLRPARFAVEWNATEMNGDPRPGQKYVIGTTFFRPAGSAQFGRLSIPLKDNNGSVSIWSQYDVIHNVDRDDVYTLMLGNIDFFKPFAPSPSYQPNQDSFCSTSIDYDDWFCNYGAWIYPTDLRLSAGQTLIIPPGIQWTYIAGNLIFDGGMLKLGSEVFVDGCVSATSPSTKIAVQWQLYNFPSTGPGYWYSPVIILRSKCALSASKIPVSVVVPADICKGAKWELSATRSTSTALVLRLTLDQSQCGMLIGIGVTLGIIVLALLVFAVVILVRCIIKRKGRNGGYRLVEWEDSIVE